MSIPLIRAVNKWGKQEKKNIVRAIDDEYKYAKGYFFGDSWSRNYKGNLEKDTIKNTFYRNVIFTGKHSQLVLMSLQPHEQIGNEVHHVDQFFRIESGRAKFVLNNGKKEFTLGPGNAVTIPAGTWHNVIALDKSVKLYTLYSPKQHPAGTKEKVRPKND